MFSQSRSVEISYPLHFERDLEPLGLSQHDYCGTQGSFGNHQSPRQQGSWYESVEELSNSTHPTLMFRQSSWESPTSSDLQSNFTSSESSSVNDCSKLSAHIQEPLSLFARNDLTLPSQNPSLLAAHAALDQNLSYSSALLPKALDNSLITQNFPEPVTRRQIDPSGIADSRPFNDITLWNQGSLSMTDELLTGGNIGPLTFSCAGDDRHAINPNFTNYLNENTMNVNNYDGGSFDQQAPFYDPVLPSGMAIDHGFWALPWPNMDTHTCDAVMMLQPQLIRDLGSQGQSQEHNGVVSTLSHPSSQLKWHGQQTSEKSMSASSGYNIDEVEVALSAEFQEAMPGSGLPTLKPKPTLCSFDVVTGVKNTGSLSSIQQKPRGRKGPLSKVGNARARQMRIERACAACKLRKTACSGKRREMCDHCMHTNSLRGVRRVACLRGPFPDFDIVFCPPFAFAHLETAPAQDWITVGDEILIQVSSGPFLDSMSFHVREIWRPDSDFLLLPDLASDSHDRMQRFAFVSSLPYALSDDNIGEVKTECRRYIKGISKSPSQALDTIQGNTSAINGLLYNVVELYWTLYAMGRDINLTVESVATALENLRNPSTLRASQKDISARILAQQVKRAMASIYKDVLRVVLSGLETKYRSNTKISCAITFCTTVVLCFITEELEIVFDGLVMYKISEKGEDPVLTAEAGMVCSQMLDDVLTYYAWPHSFGSCRKYNFIKDQCLKEDSSPQNQGLFGLADDFSRILREFEDDITDLAQIDGIGGSKYTGDHKRLASRSGRKVSRYLKKFY